jgi:hypothetical protein
LIRFSIEAIYTPPFDLLSDYCGWVKPASFIA